MRCEFSYVVVWYNFSYPLGLKFDVQYIKIVIVVCGTLVQHIISFDWYVYTVGQCIYIYIRLRIITIGKSNCVYLWVK